MRVLLINKFLYPKGGDAIVTLETGKLLSEKGNDVSFWGMQHADNPDYQYHEDFIPFVDLNASGDITKKLKIMKNIFYSSSAKTLLKRVINKFKPDIVHLHNIAHQISPSIIDVLKAHNIPCVMTLHDYKLVCASYKLLSQGQMCERCHNGKYYHCFLRGCVKDSKIKSLINTLEMYFHHLTLRIYHPIKTFISPSLFLKKKLEEMGFKGQISYLPNFIRSQNYIPKYESQEKAVVYFGRLSNEKGIETLIAAFKRLPEIGLKIIGDGPLKENLQHMVKTENINNIRFLGHMSSEELNQEISQSRFTVIPSQWYENNPRSIIESFALGKPVIGANIGGIPELIKDHKTGLTFIPGNSDDLKSKVEYLMNQPQLVKNMGNAARIFVENKLNAYQHYNALMTIYRHALN